MSLAAFLVIALGGAGATFAIREWYRASIVVSVALVLLAFAAAMTIHAGDTVRVAETALVATDFTRLVAVLGSLAAAMLCLLALATGWQSGLPASALGTIGALTVALSAPEPTSAVLATIAAGFAGVLAIGTAPARDGGAPPIGRALRAVVLAGALGFLGVLLIDDPIGAFTIDPAVLGLAYIAATLAVAIRFAAIPFHLWAGRLADGAPGITVPIVLAWTPAVLAVVMLAWTDSSISPLLAPLGVERAIIVGLGAITIILGAFAAWIQDDVEHVVAYSIAQDAGFVLLALGALDPVAWEPARTWVIILALTKTALSAWAVALRTSFGTRRLHDLAGWATGAPVLAIALAAIAVATVGWPGSAAWSARGALIRAAMTDPLGIVVTLGGLSTLLVYGRLLALGVAAPSGLVTGGARWRPRLAQAPSARGARGEVATRGGYAIARLSSTGVGRTAGSADSEPEPEREPILDEHARAEPDLNEHPGPEPIDVRGSLSARARRLGSRWTERSTESGHSPTATELFELNRAPFAAAVVLVLAAIAVGGAAGGLGIPDAARSTAPVAPDVLHPIGVPAPSGSLPAPTATPGAGADSPTP